MNRTVQIYIEGQRLELFNDETITINSSVQNINDISKVFTDLSQTFTVPASPHNNAIFQHFYNNDVDFKNTEQLNYQIRRNANIEVDLTPLRSGLIQVEKSNLKNGQPYSYTIVFYGQLTSLKDRFGEDKLSNLNYTAYSHSYTGAEVYNRVISATDFDIRYPLISSQRVWQYGSGSQNIGNSSHRIEYQELFPAIKINRIFDAIENQYGVTLDGTIRSDKRFDSCFLYLKNKDVMNVTTSPVLINIPTSTARFFNATTDEINLDYVTLNSLLLSGNITNYEGFHYIDINITPSIAAQYYADIYFNGQLMSTYTFVGSDIINLADIPNIIGLGQKVQVYLRSEQAMSFTTSYVYTFNYSYVLNGIPQTGQIVETSNNGTTTLASLLDINSLMPDMKVADFLSGIIKEFNLTIIPNSETSFNLETVNNWYDSGTNYNITEFTDIASIDIERIKLYKKIQFKHEESKSFMNAEFKETNLREYGSLEYQFNNDGSEYIVDLPFENILFSKIASNLQVGYCLEKNDFKPYIPKPILLYANDRFTCDTFYLRDGATTHAVNAYVPFGQDMSFNATKYSLNFGNDISSFYEVNIPNSMYITWYNTYLSNLFQRKNRLTYVKTKLPLYILSGLKLNDRLTIRDKRYIINDMKIDLTSGIVDFVLLNDLTQIVQKTFFKYISNGQDFNTSIVFPNKAISVDLDLTLAHGAILNPSVITESTALTINVPVYKPAKLKERVIADGGIFENGCITDLYPDYHLIKVNYIFSTFTTFENITIFEVW